MRTFAAVLIAVSVVVANASFAIAAEHRSAGQAQHAAEQSDSSEEKHGRRLIKDIRTLLAGVIVLTDKECATLGEDWVPYELISGRFALAAGSHTDSRGELQTFALGDNSHGTYSHQLTVDQMPSHIHPYHDRYFNNDRGGGDHGDDDDTDRHYKNDRRNTGAIGGSLPHNNMPPYLVLNFCHNTASPK